MQDAAVILGGFESVYMQKLALYLNSRMGGRVRVGIAGSSLPEADRDTVWIGSENFLSMVRARSEDARCILLSEEPGDGSAVYRYQSREKLFQQIILRYRQFPGTPADLPGSGRQRWIVITTEGAAASLLAFSVTCAQILREQGRILYLNLSECSGMAELFQLEPETDLSDLIASLRKEEPVCIEAFVRQIEEIDYIMPSANPMILHELRGSDIDRLIEAVGQREEYASVVVALGNTCCGCERFFRMAERILHLTESGLPCACSRREWMDFISMCTGPGETRVEQIRLPQIEAEGSGFHLLQTWQEGALGQMARIYLEGEAQN